MQKADRVYLVGIGYRPLGSQARDIVMRTDVLLASPRLLDVFSRYEEYEAIKDRITVIETVPETIAFIKERFSQSAKGPLVMLASGDPFFFGIGRRMIEEFGAQRIEILPDLSSMQEAFARINVSWDDTFCISVHGGPDIARRRTLPYEVSDIPRLIQKYHKIAVLTDRQNNPARIAGAIMTTPEITREDITIYVCERLGYPDERVWTGTINEAAGMTFADPNVLIILRPPTGGGGREIAFGMRENELSHRDGLITKDEVRAVSLHKLRLPDKGLLWDIGAGSGSVAIEAARLSPGLTVAAVESDEKQVEHIRANKTKLDVRNLEIIPGAAPEALAGLGTPVRIFIGGSGGRLAGILEKVNEKMPAGIIVINAATLETLQEAVAALERFGFSTDVTEVSVARSKIVAGRKLMNAMNPVFIVKGERS